MEEHENKAQSQSGDDEEDAGGPDTFLVPSQGSGTLRRNHVGHVEHVAQGPANVRVGSLQVGGNLATLQNLPFSLFCVSAFQFT